MWDRGSDQQLVPSELKSSQLRVAVVGSVDDGKSTLMGRLLLSLKALRTDQREALTFSSQSRGRATVDLSFAADGLKHERDQGITMDVAHLYAQLSGRKLIFADCPGHLQFTGNMVTGLSRADAAIFLADASRGLGPLSPRHLEACWGLRVPKVIAVINKMDAVDFSPSIFNGLREQILDLLEGLPDPKPKMEFIPLSALTGQGVTERAPDMPWYTGDCLLDALAALEPRCPPPTGSLWVQDVGPHPTNPALHRALGRWWGSNLASGDYLQALKDDSRTLIRIAGLEVTSAQRRVTARAGDSVALDFDVPLQRGFLLVSTQQPMISTRRCLSRLLIFDAGKELVDQDLSLHLGTLVVPVRVEWAQPVGRSGLLLQVRLQTDRPIWLPPESDQSQLNRGILVSTSTGVTVSACVDISPETDS